MGALAVASIIFGSPALFDPILQAASRIYTPIAALLHQIQFLFPLPDSKLECLSSEFIRILMESRLYTDF